MSVPARSATSRDAAGSICCPASAHRLAHELLGLSRDLPEIDSRVLAPLQPPALDDGGLLLKRLVQAARPIDV